jgi:hypothetical protein
MSKVTENLTVLIGSCDSYSILWKNFQICFDRYWDHDTDNIFVTEQKIVDNFTKKHFKSVLSSKKSWGARMLDGISECKTKYVLFLLEDYFLDYKYSESQLEEYIDLMNLNTIDRLQISPSDFQSYNRLNENVSCNKYLQFNKYSLYSISMQPSIWNVDYLKYVLLPEYSPWDFEINGSQKIANDLRSHSIFIDSTMQNVYFNAVRKGFIKNNNWDSFRIKHCLEDF